MRHRTVSQALARVRLLLEELERRETPAFLALPPFDSGSTAPKLVVAADFNGDGLADLAVGHESGGPQGGPFVSVLLGDGDGTFTAAPSLAGAALDIPRAMVAADFNADGQLDLVIATSQSTNGSGPGSLIALQGNGDGTFTGPTFLDSQPAFAVGVADFTSDSVLDLVVLQPSLVGNSYRVFTGNGDVTFTVGAAQPTTMNVNRFVAADFDGDGNFDFAGLDSASSTLAAYYGAGNGTFGAAVAASLGNTPNDLIVGDFDGDGAPDVAVAANTFSTVVLNTVTFHQNLGGQNGFNGAGTDILAPASLPNIDRLASADVDRNGLPDAIAIGSGQVFVATSDGGGTFTPDAGNPYFTTPTFGVGDVAAGDIDGDGNIDVITIGQDSLGGGNTGDVFLNLAPDFTQTTLSSDPNPSAELQTVTLTATVTPLVPSFPTSGPPTGIVQFVSGESTLGSAPLVNGVALLPVSGLTVGSYPIVAFYVPGGTNAQFESSTSPVLTQTVDGPPPQTFAYQVTGGNIEPGTTPSRVASGDFTGDEIDDIAIGTGAGQPARVQIVDGTSRTVILQVSVFEASFTGGTFVALGDINGDGRADLAVSADAGGGSRVVVFLNRDSGFEVAADFLAFDAEFRGGTRIALGDVNRDGFADLIVVPGEGGGPRVATFDGQSLRSGTAPQRLWNDFFAMESSSRLGLYVAAGDLNSDGFGDLIVGSDFGGGPRVLIFNGAELGGGSIAMLASFFSGSPDDRNGVRVAARDFDNDGTFELLTGAGPGSASIVRLYTGSSIVSGSTPVPFFETDAFPGFSVGVFVA